jgi:hypothetical protein
MPRNHRRRAAGELFAASARAVYDQAVGLPVIAALVLIGATWRILDAYGAQVLIGVAVVLGFALVSAIDDPERSILAATAYSPTRRSLFRVAAAVAIITPLWLAAAAAVAWRADGVPIRTLALQTATLWAVGVAVAVTVSYASASVSPSYIATPALLALTLAADALPRGWQMFNAQTWGPPWAAAQLRWTAVLALAFAVIALLLRDPMDQRPQLECPYGLGQSAADTHAKADDRS